MQERSRGRRRVVVLDADEWEYLPEEIFIPLRPGTDASGVTKIELHEMTDSRMALLVYSSMERLIAAQGDDQVAMKRPAGDLPRLRQQLQFQAVLLDVRVPTERILPAVREKENIEPLPLTLDAETGEPMVFVPSRAFHRGDSRAQVELQQLANGQLALLTYSSLPTLADGCGSHQHYVAFPTERLEQVRRLTRADTVLIDTPLPAHLRHSH